MLLTDPWLEAGGSIFVGVVVGGETFSVSSAAAVFFSRRLFKSPFKSAMSPSFTSAANFFCFTSLSVFLYSVLSTGIFVILR